MKKILKSILLAMLILGMIFCLTACGNKEENTTGNEVAENNQTANVETEKKEFSMGKWEGNVYTNDFLGLKYNLPAGWEYSSDEEIAETMNIGVELLNDDQKAAAEIAKLTSVYYISTNDPKTGNNVSIMSEKPVIDVTTEYYINQLKTQLTSVESISYEIGETSRENVAGIECDTLTCNASMMGVTMIQKYYVYKVDKYVVCIIATSTTGESEISDEISCFE